MKDKTNFELAHHFLDEVWQKGNEDAIFHEFEGVATGLWPDEEGIDPHGFLQYHRALKPLIKDLTFEFLKHHEEGDHLWVSWIVWGKHWKNSDKILRWPGAATSRYREGKMVECNNHHDFMLLFSQLELVPEQAFEHGLAGYDIVEAELRRRDELPPSAKGKKHFLWPGMRRVVSSGHELYLPCSPRQILAADGRQEVELPDEEQLEILFESTAFAMVLVDAQDRILQAGPAFSEMVDRLPESLPGHSFHQFILPEDQVEERALFAELCAESRSHYRHRIRLVRGRTVLWAQLSVARIPTLEGGFRIVRALQESSRVEDLVDFQETERKMLSLELHDGLAQDLATLWIYLHTGKQQEQPLPSLLDRCLNVVERASKELRNRMRDLRSPILEGTLLVEAIESLASRVSNENGLTVDLELGQDLAQCDNTNSLLLYRVIQEALRNAVNHSGTKKCWVCLHKRDQMLVGSVRDEGSGFDLDSARAKGRLGLRGMADRCELVGGSLSIHSRVGSGTVLEFVIPWAPDRYDA